MPVSDNPKIVRKTRLCRHLSDDTGESSSVGQFHGIVLCALNAIHVRPIERYRARGINGLHFELPLSEFHDLARIAIAVLHHDDFGLGAGADRIRCIERRDNAEREPGFPTAGDNGLLLRVFWLRAVSSARSIHRDRRTVAVRRTSELD